MRRGSYSVSVKDFDAALKRAVSLQNIERKSFVDPPRPEDYIAVESLRSSSVVAIVSAIEGYLRSALEEFVEFLAARVVRSDHAKLPSGVNQNNDVNYIEWIIRDSKWQNLRKHGELQRISALIAEAKFIPEAFSRTRSNPGVETVKALLKDFGIRDPYQKINANMAAFFSRNIEQNSAEALLTTIVTRRNQIAHGVTTLSIARADLRIWIEFAKCFVRAIDKALNRHVFEIIDRI